MNNLDKPYLDLNETWQRPREETAEWQNGCKVLWTPKDWTFGAAVDLCTSGFGVWIAFGPLYFGLGMYRGFAV